MASNSITFKVKVEKDGSLKVVAKEAGKAAKATDDLGKSTDDLTKKRNKHNAVEKSLHQTGLSGAKAFSKQRNAIGGGSSGLVGAYAVLAANVFALTAAFGALQRAAQVKQLEEGLTSMGTASGVAMKQLSQGLREATGNALSLEDAMRATAMASSAGFDSSSIQRLGDVARKASIALGRDTADSLNRLTKGAIKLEPELLDELGIMVRLDTATQDYARSVNKSVDDLTTFEKRQAFMNAVLEEGEAKFAAMANVPTNPFDQLSATFQDLTKTILGFLNKGLLPVVSFFANSQMALFGGMVVFAKGIATSMIPALGDLAGRYEEVRAKAKKASLGQVAQLKNWKGSSQAMKKVLKNFDPLNTSQKELNKILATANRTLKTNISQEKQWIKNGDKTVEQLAEKTQRIRESQQAVDDAATASFNFANAQREEGDTLAVSQAAQGDFKKSLKSLGEQFNQANIDTAKATKGTSFWTMMTLKAKNMSYKMSLSLKVLGTAFLTAIPWIGAIIAAFGILVSVGSKVIAFFKSDEQKEYEETLKRQAEANKELGESLKAVSDFNEGNASTISNVTQKYTALANTFGTMKKQLDVLNKSGETAMSWGGGLAGMVQKWLGKEGGYKSMFQTLIKSGALSNEVLRETAASMDDATKMLVEAGIAFKDLGHISDSTAKKFLNMLIPGFYEAAEVIRNMTMAVKESNQAIDTWANSISFKTSVDNMLGAFSNMENSMKKSGEKNAEEWIEGFKENAGENLLDLIDFDKLNRKGVGGMGEGMTWRTPEERKQSIKDAITEYKGILKTQQATERTNKAQQAGHKANIQSLKKENTFISKSQEILTEENKIRDLQISLLETTIDNVRALNKLGEDEKDTGGVILAYEAEIANLRKQKAIEADNALATAKDDLRIAELKSKATLAALDGMQKMQSMQKSLVDSAEKEAEIKLKERNRADPRRGYKSALNAADKLELASTKIKDVMMIDEKGQMSTSKTAMTITEARKQAAINEYNMTLLKDKIERNLLRLRLIAVDKELQLAHVNAGKTGNYEGRGDLQGFISQLGDKGPFATLQANLANSIKTATINGITEGVNKTKEDKKAEVLGATGSNPLEVMQNMDEAGGLGSLEHTSEKVAGVRAVLAPMMEDLKKLGPEGELVASVAQGALVMAESWSGAFEKIKDASGGMEKTSLILGAVAQTVQQIGAIMAASSRAKIAGIDKEIEAEKKRDGKSKASKAKISQLEKKREAEARKAFERNKKLQMASAVISTASAVVGALAWDPKGWWNIPLAAMIGAMGMAQLALIAGQSYQGGASSGGGGMGPTGIAVGERKKTSDLATSKSARGELAYFRGDQGVGGAESFRGAFYGKKHRAYGGNTGYVVGEQGPELFMPDRPGTIVPADDVNEMGEATYVTFNINTIDASGVEEVLQEQRGNIIGMLRGVANEHGEDFMESVDESAYTNPVVAENFGSGGIGHRRRR